MINKVILLGTLGKDAELKGDGDKSVLSISLATSDGYFDKNREWVDVAEWHAVRFFGKYASKYAGLIKGSKIYVEGKIKTTTKKDSKEKYHQIIADKIKLVSKPAHAPSPPLESKGSSEIDFDQDIPF